MITIAQYATLIYTTEMVQNFGQMISRAPAHMRDAEARLVREMQDEAADSDEIGYLFH